MPPRMTMGATLSHPLAAQTDEHGTAIVHGPDTPNGYSGVQRRLWGVRLEEMGSAGAHLRVPTPIRPDRLGRPRPSRAERVQRRRHGRNR